MTKSQVIEILKGLLMEEKVITQEMLDKLPKDREWVLPTKELDIENAVIREQNSKIQAVIDRLGKDK